MGDKNNLLQDSKSDCTILMTYIKELENNEGSFWDKEREEIKKRTNRNRLGFVPKPTKDSKIKNAEKYLKTIKNSNLFKTYKAIVDTTATLTDEVCEHLKELFRYAFVADNDQSFTSYWPEDQKDALEFLYSCNFDKGTICNTFMNLVIDNLNSANSSENKIFKQAAQFTESIKESIKNQTLYTKHLQTFPFNAMLNQVSEISKKLDSIDPKRIIQTKLSSKHPIEAGSLKEFDWKSKTFKAFYYNMVNAYEANDGSFGPKVTFVFKMLENLTVIDEIVSEELNKQKAQGTKTHCLRINTSNNGNNGKENNTQGEDTPNGTNGGNVSTPTSHSVTNTPRSSVTDVEIMPTTQQLNNEGSMTVS